MSGLTTLSLCNNVNHPLSEVTNILYLLALVILLLFSLVDTITEGSWHLLIIYYWLTHYLFLLLLAQYSSLVACVHEHGAMDVGAGWKQDICHFQQVVAYEFQKWRLVQKEQRTAKNTCSLKSYIMPFQSPWLWNFKLCEGHNCPLLHKCYRRSAEDRLITAHPGHCRRLPS